MRGEAVADDKEKKNGDGGTNSMVTELGQKRHRLDRSIQKISMVRVGKENFPEGRGG